MLAQDRFTDYARDKLRDEIRGAGGNEVFAVCVLDGEGIVADLKVAARGSRSAVPALAPYLERGGVLVHNHPSGLLEPSEADLAVASRVGDMGVGSYIVDNEVERVYVTAEPVARTATEPLDADKLASVLEEGGALARRLAGYEPRESQIGLLRLVARAFNEDSVCAAEAGTGVGKSFAYLIPAMGWAARNKERVIVSTGTINLQEQLVGKDIPAVNALFREKVKAVLVKGRANYLCRTRLAEALEEEGLFGADPESQLSRIAAWAETSPSGSKSDLSFMPDEAVWARVCAEGDFCLNMRCANRDSCFVIAMKREAADAQVLVTNHHLLFSDLSARLGGAGYENTAVLPPFSRIVMDEAHNIEASATSYFSQELNRFAVYRQLGRLYHEKRGRRFGAVIRLQNLASSRSTLFKALPDHVAGVRQAATDADAAALELLGEEGSFRVTPATAPAAAPVMEALSLLEKRINALLQALQDILEALPEDAEDDIAVFEARILLKRLSALGSVCSLFRRWEDNPEQVFWIEKGRSAQKEPFATFYATPINISSMMREAVYGPFPTVVCTSATLTVAGSFSYWEARTGLSRFEDKPLITGVFPSPFPFATNVLLGVPTDAPAPDQPGYHEFVARATRSALEISGGHGLVLFTSYEALRRCYDEVRPALNERGIACLRQGDDDRSRLLDRFKSDDSSVLFATDSFWEGVDAPGSTLQLVIIAKLPFKVPTDPVQKARAEAIEKAGGNSFMDLSLPEAVMKLKQGFGRLMRRSDDSGAVLILDSRLVAKRYGSLFLDSLPKTRRAIKPLCGVMEDLERFLYSR